MPIHHLLPEAEVLLALEPAELGGFLLEFLNSEDGRSYLNVVNLTNYRGLEGYPRECTNQVAEALSEAWNWLEHEGLVAPKPGDTSGWYIVPRRGRKLKGRLGVEAFRKANILPRHLVQPVIEQAVWSLFIRGDYETAIFQAFKEVEIAVRAAGGFASTDIGVDLMRKAFDPSSGPLTDASLPGGERVAISNLFAGAIGYGKNPSSHRHVQLSDPVEAVELILIASHLLRIVDTADQI